jgi:prepilin-type N-terminal cleavage/methylation domain-containing protein
MTAEYGKITNQVVCRMDACDCVAECNQSGVRMKRAFTLIEMMITVVILGILATTAIAGYQGIMAKSKLQTDKVNVMMLLQATKVYYLENDKIPATLASLDARHFDRAYAEVLNTPAKRLAYAAMIRLNNDGVAFAAGDACPPGSTNLDAFCRDGAKMGLKPSQFVSAAKPGVWFKYSPGFLTLTNNLHVLWEKIPTDMPIVNQDGAPNKINNQYFGVVGTKGGAVTYSPQSTDNAPPGPFYIQKAVGTMAGESTVCSPAFTSSEDPTMAKRNACRAAFRVN